MANSTHCRHLNPASHLQLAVVILRKGGWRQQQLRAAIAPSLNTVVHGRRSGNDASGVRLLLRELQAGN
jgi:hypothetical protein